MPSSEVATCYSHRW